MALLTEAELRERLKAENLEAMTEYRVEPGTIVTPSAKAFLSDNKIRLVTGGSAQGDNGNLPAFQKPARYESVYGGWFDEKPENMTALRGTKLVNKTHPVVRFRGRMDSMDARVLAAQFALQKLGYEKTAADLGEVQAYLQEILRCEVLEQPLPERRLLGLSEEEIRARSHTPKKYYGLAHFAAAPEHGEAVAVLNSLRTEVRELELCACDAFQDAHGVLQRVDLVRALNRLSSLFYVMMFKLLAKEYD